jgi:hypothetical protein
MSVQFTLNTDWSITLHNSRLDEATKTEIFLEKCIATFVLSEDYVQCLIEKPVCNCVFDFIGIAKTCNHALKYDIAKRTLETNK